MVFADNCLSRGGKITKIEQKQVHFVSKPKTNSNKNTNIEID